MHSNHRFQRQVRFLSPNLLHLNILSKAHSFLLYFPYLKDVRMKHKLKLNLINIGTKLFLSISKLILKCYIITVYIRSVYDIPLSSLRCKLVFIFKQIIVWLSSTFLRIMHGGLQTLGVTMLAPL